MGGTAVQTPAAKAGTAPMQKPQHRLGPQSMPFHLDEPLGIDPCVDIVFLWLFGAEEHESIRVDFLNAVLAPDQRIVRTHVVNPVHPGSFEGQAGIRLDIQVTDEKGRTFQIEMQRQRPL